MQALSQTIRAPYIFSIQYYLYKDDNIYSWLTLNWLARFFLFWVSSHKSATPATPNTRVPARSPVDTGIATA